jgi:hypothetical protein
MRMPGTTGIELYQASRRWLRDSHDPHHGVSARGGSRSSGQSRDALLPAEASHASMKPWRRADGRASRFNRHGSTVGAV